MLHLSSKFKYNYSGLYEVALFFIYLTTRFPHPSRCWV